MLYTFTPNTFYTNLLNVEPSRLEYLRSYKSEFDDTIITFTDQNGRPLQKEDNLNLTLFINE